MLAAGHSQAKSYTLGMVEMEAVIVAKRNHLNAVSQAALYQLAISTIPNESVKAESTKKAAKKFDEILKGSL